MLEGYFALLFLISSIYGYSGLLKKALINSKEIFNIDYVYGVLFLSVISIFLNLFFPLRYFSLFFLFLGFFLFIIFLFLKYFKLNFYILFLVSFYVLYISHGQGIQYDSQLYHLQLLQLSSNQKVIFGIGNLQPHYAMNSSWHSMLGLINFSFNKIDWINFANLSIFTIFITVALNEFLLKKKKLSSFFLLLSVLYIVSYSFFHPYGNGTILNMLGSPEVDLPASIFFIITVYLLIKYYEEPKIETLRLILVSSFLLITIKISYIGVFLLLLYAIFYKKNNFYIFEKIYWFLFFGSVLWFTKSIVYSGCFIFPVSFTCIPTFWALNIDEIKSYSNIVQSFARDTPLRLNFTDFEYTLNSWKWLIPWIKEYFLKTEFLLISFLITFAISIYYIFYFFYNKTKINSLYKNFYFHIFVLILFNLLIWFKAPEIRFGYGSIISLVCFLMSYFIFDRFKNYLNNYKISNFIILVIFSSIFVKNFDNIKNFQEGSFIRNFNYMDFENIYSVNGYKFYKPIKDNFCNNFQGFCTYQGFKVNIDKRYSYIFMRKN